jgi:divalent metal cation (Fe/Co/Zn/Cd) transporter
MSDLHSRYYRYALWLGYFTILYNLLEGLVSVFFGLHDETLTLFGFGVDSFIEVLSGIGIIAMVYRMRRHPESERTRFERAALRVTGTSFYLLTLGLGASVIVNLFTHNVPHTTLPGLIIALISIASMGGLVAAKRHVGRTLNSAPILADANCTLVCIYMSLVLLGASLVYQLTGFGFTDSLGALGLMYFSFTEGREAFEKASGVECECEPDCNQAAQGTQPVE